MVETISEMVQFVGVESVVPAYLARPLDGGPNPAVMIIHEIFGLDDHIKSVADRFAVQGYVALAPHLFSRSELSEVMKPAAIHATIGFMNTVQPERLGNPVYLQDMLSKQPAEQREQIACVLPMLMGGLPIESLTEEMVRGIEYLRKQSFVNGKIGSIGFCFGGGMSINLACHAVFDAAVVFYGSNPNPISLVEKIACPVLGIYGAEDTRINIRLDELVRAMVQYRKDFEMKIYSGAAHAFFNENYPQGYREAAAVDAWSRVLTFFGKNLK